MGRCVVLRPQQDRTTQPRGPCVWHVLTPVWPGVGVRWFSRNRWRNHSQVVHTQQIQPMLRQGRLSGPPLSGGCVLYSSGGMEGAPRGQPGKPTWCQPVSPRQPTSAWDPGIPVPGSRLLWETRRFQEQAGMVWACPAHHVHSLRASATGGAEPGLT